MAEIKEIYNKDEYYPFLLYCESRGFTDMVDLIKCDFNKLRGELSTVLLSKIKMIFVMYCKQHANEFRSAGKTNTRPAKSAVSDEELEKLLHDYFVRNQDKLIRIAEIAKGIGKKTKRTDIIRVLNQAPWCRAVDETTFFYANVQS